MKHQTPSSIKFRKLMRRLGVDDMAKVVGTLELLWIATQKNAPRGDIGKFDNETIAMEVHWRDDADFLIQCLIDTGWLDEHEEHRLVVHDWHVHAPKWVCGVAGRQGGFATGAIVANEPQNVGDDVEFVADDTADRGEQPNLTQPNPTQRNPTPPEPSADAVVEDLKKLGVGQARQSVSTAIENGVPLSEVRAICRFFGNRPGAWKPGALCRKIENASPGDPVEHGWPTPAKSFQIRGDPEIEARKAAESERLAKSRRFVQRRKELRECEPEHRRFVLSEEFGEMMVSELGSNVESISDALKKVTQGGLG